MNAPYRLLSPQDRVRFWGGLAQRAVPGLTVLAMTALMTMPLFASFPLFPHLAMLGVFVWVTFQPRLMPTWLAFLLGCAADILGAVPLGINACLLPLVAIFVRGFEDRFGRHRYGFDWGMAAIVILAFEGLTWVLLDFTGTRGPFAPLLFQSATTILAYPAVVLFCARLQRRLTEAL